MSAGLEDYRWLVSDAAQPWLARVGEDVAKKSGPTASLLERLRKDLSAARAHLVVEQCELRGRAREKFSLAERMFFTRKGLEQATDEPIATCKASRFPAGETVADLCCGIGGDALALARRRPVVAADLDPVCCLLTAANGRGCEIDENRLNVKTTDAATISVGNLAAWHIDPDRRAQGRRTTRVELFEPPLESIESLLAANPNAAIKLAPAAEAPAAWAGSAELEWLGSRGECRQQMTWFGSLARHPSRRSATIVDGAGGPRTITGSGDEPIPVSKSLGHFIYEPHSAILAAELTGAVCLEHSLQAVTTGIAYLTSDALVSDSALAAFKVLEFLPLDQKQLKAWCREHRIGRLEVKKRGVDVDPEKLRKAIIANGDHAATLIVTPLQGKVRVIVAERLG